jgi:hypothetical protein
MSPLRLSGSTSGYSQLDAPAIAGDQTFTLPGTGGTIDRLNRAGNILQVVNAGYSTYTTIASTSFTDTGLTASITPTSSSNKILVVVSLAAFAYRSSNAGIFGNLNIVRGVTQVRLFERAFGGSTGTDVAGGIGFRGLHSLVYLDSPATTSSTSYKVQASASTTSNSGSIELNDYSTGAGNNFCSMTLLEVAA